MDGAAARRAGAIVRRQAGAGLAWCLLTGSAAARATVSGIPAGPRLRLVLRGRRAARARGAAEAELRARLAAFTASPRSAGPAFTVFEDSAVREPRFAPRLFPPPKGPTRGPAAMRATLRATAYFGADPSLPGRTPQEPAAAGPEPGPEPAADAPHGPGSGRVTRDLPDRPLPEHFPIPGRRPRVVRYRAFAEPPDVTVAAVRAAHGAVLRWTSEVTYLTVNRWPVLGRLTGKP